MNQPPVNASYANTLESSPSSDFFSPAQVAAVYTVLPHIRTAESVINRDKKQDNVIHFRPPVRNKRVFASVERTAEQVIEEAFDEALKRDPENKRQWVIVVDGHPHQLNPIEK